ncbi:DUF1579 domain-containing protein [Phytoactinopolyspora halotolerans]|uniref:DUF1579 domain-containing protein n=1 Tax=Phytoactinopolyspora halotolerans TaxID=1981512 RepID=A0A6L9SCJ6_9ACTN|nr:DUF1579 domain-containing protein [Phytoactinopolyspora halotolerans]
MSRLDAFVGEWELEVRFPPGHPAAATVTDDAKARSRFEWALNGQFLLQHTEITIPEAPDSLTIISVDPNTGAYTQHYYDTRGVVRVYAMEFAAGVWTLLRETPDFSPLDFRQRFAGTFSDDGRVISGAWEIGSDGADWELDFDLIYRRAG